jgi:hypothetical protein
VKLSSSHGSKVAQVPPDKLRRPRGILRHGGHPRRLPGPRRRRRP